MTMLALLRADAPAARGLAGAPGTRTEERRSPDIRYGVDTAVHRRRSHGPRSSCWPRVRRSRPPAATDAGARDRVLVRRPGREVRVRGDAHDLRARARATSRSPTRTRSTSIRARASSRRRAGGVEVFKHHWSERVPTEHYDYDFSTMTLHARRGPRGLSSSPLPRRRTAARASRRSGATDDACAGRTRCTSPARAGARARSTRRASPLVDALTLVLRDFHFDAPQRARRCSLVPSQKDTHAVPFEPVDAHGALRRDERARAPDRKRAKRTRSTSSTPGGAARRALLVRGDGAAPWLHALVRFEGRSGSPTG